MTALNAVDVLAKGMHLLLPVVERALAEHPDLDRLGMAFGESGAQITVNDGRHFRHELNKTIQEFFAPHLTAVIGVLGNFPPAHGVPRPLAFFVDRRAQSGGPPDTRCQLHLTPGAGSLAVSLDATLLNGLWYLQRPTVELLLDFAQNIDDTMFLPRLIEGDVAQAVRRAADNNWFHKPTGLDAHQMAAWVQNLARFAPLQEGFRKSHLRANLSLYEVVFTGPPPQSRVCVTAAHRLAFPGWRAAVEPYIQGGLIELG